MSEQEFWMQLCAGYAAKGDSPAMAAAKADDGIEEMRSRFYETVESDFPELNIKGDSNGKLQ